MALYIQILRGIKIRDIHNKNKRETLLDMNKEKDSLK